MGKNVAPTPTTTRRLVTWLSIIAKAAADLRAGRGENRIDNRKLMTDTPVPPSTFNFQLLPSLSRCPCRDHLYNLSRQVSSTIHNSPNASHNHRPTPQLSFSLAILSLGDSGSSISKASHLLRSAIRPLSKLYFVVGTSAGQFRQKNTKLRPNRCKKPRLSSGSTTRCGGFADEMLLLPSLIVVLFINDTREHEMINVGCGEYGIGLGTCVSRHSQTSRRCILGRSNNRVDPGRNVGTMRWQLGRG